MWHLRAGQSGSRAAPQIAAPPPAAAGALLHWPQLPSRPPPPVESGGERPTVGASIDPIRLLQRRRRQGSANCSYFLHHFPPRRPIWWPPAAHPVARPPAQGPNSPLPADKLFGASGWRRPDARRRACWRPTRSGGPAERLGGELLPILTSRPPSLRQAASQRHKNSHPNRAAAAQSHPAKRPPAPINQAPSGQPAGQVAPAKLFRRSPLWPSSGQLRAEQPAS